ncbi:MAG: flagellin [Planctomycetota bacterium]|nr:flagellin [Planctomycetota bacterium]
MSLSIHDHTPAINASRFANQAQRNLSDALQRLSSGFKVNQAREGPAALIISEFLRSQMGGIERSMRNTQEANNVLAIAEGALSQISDQLTQMRELALHALNSGVTSPSQVSADQAQINANLNTISRIANNTRYSDQNLLNGGKSIAFAADDAAGLLDLTSTRLQEIAARQGQNISIAFAGGASQQAEKAYVETNLGGGTALTNGQRLVVSGNRGAVEFSFAAGTAIADMAAAINARAAQTGVTAYAIRGGTELRLVSAEYGAEQWVRVEQKEGSAFAAAGNVVTDRGQNATITVAGQTLQTNGLRLEAEVPGAKGVFVFNAGSPAATTIAQTGYDQDTLTDATAGRSAVLRDFQGGMQLQLGETAGNQSRTVFGLNSMDLSNLGRVTAAGRAYSLADLQSGGAASLANNPEMALRVIDQAIADVASERARIGAYQANALSVAFENVMATESAIRDADMAEEVANFVREQILAKSGLMAVQSANSNRQHILKLLGLP